MLDSKVPSSFDQFIREHVDLHTKNEKLKADNAKLVSHNRQLMDQLRKQIEANDKLLQRLKKIENNTEDDYKNFV